MTAVFTPTWMCRMVLFPPPHPKLWTPQEMRWLFCGCFKCEIAFLGILWSCISVPDLLIVLMSSSDYMCSFLLKWFTLQNPPSAFGSIHQELFPCRSEAICKRAAYSWMQLEHLSDSLLESMVNQRNIQYAPIIILGHLLDCFHLGSGAGLILLILRIKSLCML